MKILLVQHLNFLNGSGGTEKICSFLANGFVKKGHQVEIATNQNISGKPIFPLDQSITVTNIFNAELVQKELQLLRNYHGKNPFLWLKYKLKKKSTKAQNKWLLKKMGGGDGLYVFNLRQRSKLWKSYLDKIRPDLIITMSIGSVLELTYKNNIDIPIINSTNGRPDHDYTDVLWYRGQQEMFLLSNAYKYLAGIQVLFESYNDFLPDTFGGISRTIANPILDMQQKDVVNHLQEKERYKIVHLGRLICSHKQQHIAVEVFEKIAHKYPDWDLEFWGEGEDYAILSHKIKAANLEDRIILKGFTDHPSEVLKKGDIFIFPSRHEGLPLALAEAMYLGLPSLGFTDCCGVNEMIVHGENGFLATDQVAMCGYLEMLMQDNDMRQRLGINAHLVMQKYAPGIVLNQWERLVDSVLSI